MYSFIHSVFFDTKKISCFVTKYFKIKFFQKKLNFISKIYEIYSTVVS